MALHFLIKYVWYDNLLISDEDDNEVISFCCVEVERFCLKLNFEFKELVIELWITRVWFIKKIQVNISYKYNY